MATAIGDLVVRLGMDTKKFDAGMAAAQRGLRATRMAVGQFAMAGTAAAAATAAVAAMAIRQAAAMDAIGKHSQRLGIATEALIGLQHAAELAGASGDVLDKGLTKMMRGIGEAVAIGTGEAKAAFEMLKLDPKELIGKSPEAQFGAIADAMKGLQSQAERTAVAAKVFGDSGTDLLPMLAGGSKAMKEATREAAELGLAFDAISAAKMAAVNDEWYRATAAMTGLQRTMAVDLAPAIGAASTALVKFFVELRKSGPALSSIFGDALKNVMKFGNALQYALEKMLEIARWDARAKLLKAIGFEKPKEEILALARELREIDRRLKAVRGQDWGKDVEATFKRISQAVAEAGAAAEVAKGPLQAALEAPQTATSKAIDLVAEWRKQIEGFGLTDRQKAIADLGGNLELGMGGALGKLDEQLTELERHAEMLKVAERLREQFVDPFDAFAEKVSTYRDLLQQGMIDQRVYDSAMADAARGFDAKPETFQQGPRYAAAAEKGSREAYSILVNSRKDGEATAKAHLAVGKKQLTVLERIDRDLKTEQSISIPTA